MSQKQPIYVDKKDKEFGENKAPIINLINSVLKTMEDIQWHFTHTHREGADTITAGNMLLFSMNRISVPESETQIIADRKALYTHTYVRGCLSTPQIMDICYRFQQYLLSTIFEVQHGITYQNPSPKHIVS